MPCGLGAPGIFRTVLSVDRRQKARFLPAAPHGQRKSDGLLGAGRGLDCGDGRRRSWRHRCRRRRCVRGRGRLVKLSLQTDYRGHSIRGLQRLARQVPMYCGRILA